jgi:hypothetical protein
MPLLVGWDLPGVGQDALDVAEDKETRKNNEGDQMYGSPGHHLFIAQVLLLVKLHQREAVAEDVDTVQHADDADDEDDG